MKRPLRIAVFVGSFPVVSETFILRQLAGLLGAGHEVRIFADTPAEAGAPIQPEVSRHGLLQRTQFMDMPEAVCPWELPAWPLTGQTWVPGASQPLSNAGRLLQALPVLASALVRVPRLTRETLRSSEYGFQAASLSALYRLARLATCKGGFDVLHAHFGPVGNSFRFAVRLWRAPLLVSFHGYDFSTVPQASGPGVYAKLFRDMRAATVNSDYMRAGLIGLGCPAEKLHKVSYGIETERFQTPPRMRQAGEPVRVLTVGRLVEKKGLEYSLRAVAAVRRQHPEVRYEIIGEGPQRPALGKLVQELGLSEVVTLHGARNAEFIREKLAAAHIFVLASVTASDGDLEGTPVSLLEAQAAALPVLATRHSGIPEIVMDGQTGFLVEEKAVEPLAERLQFLVEHPDACGQMGVAERRFVETTFRQSAALRQLLALYERVCTSP